MSAVNADSHAEKSTCEALTTRLAAFHPPVQTRMPLFGLSFFFADEQRAVAGACGVSLVVELTLFGTITRS